MATARRAGSLFSRSPDQVDIEDLAEARAEAARCVAKPPQAGSARVRAAAASVGAAGVAVAAWTATVPAKLLGLARMSRGEWSALFGRGWAAVKKEAHHFWVGTKLLYAEMRISARLLHGVLRGQALTRRERRQLTRTTADMFRLVPLLVILVVPFMEFALPVLLKVFPNMLPSTFQDKLKHEEALKSQLTAKLELARFLQDTTEEMARSLSKHRSGDVAATAAELYDFMKRVRSGAVVSNSDIKRFAKLFNDEITLDSVDRVQLVNLARFVAIPPYGTDTFLRYQLRAALRAIKADDRLIAAEGTDSLSYDELRAACRSRGMRWDGESVASMRAQLDDWLELSLHAALPSSLLLLSRAFTITHHKLVDPESAAVSDLNATLASLPDEVLKAVELDRCSVDDSAEQKLRRLESLRHEEAMILEEKEDREAAAAAAAAAEAAAAGAVDVALAEMSRPTAMATPASGGAAASPCGTPSLGGASLAPAPPPSPPEPALSVVPGPGGELILDEASKGELTAAAAAVRRRLARRVAKALATLAGSSPVAEERAEFEELLRKEVDRSEEAVESGDAASLIGGTGQGRLSKRLSRLLSGLDKELAAAQQSIGQRLHRLDLNRDGKLDRAELASATAGLLADALKGEDLRSILGDALFDEDGCVRVADLVAMAEEEEEEERDDSDEDHNSDTKK